MAEKAIRELTFDEPLLIERSVPGRVGYSLPQYDEKCSFGEAIPASYQRERPPVLPELSELDVMRHFVRLSRRNYHIDGGMYPLGSCTMKYNPKINEAMARLDGFGGLHPNLPVSYLQGALALIHELQNLLAEISGMHAVTLHPNAGAHGEWLGVRMIRKRLIERDGSPRKLILVPDSAHGTNPATCTLNNYKVVSLKTGPDGVLEPSEVERLMGPDVAGIMVTNPNTLGLYERNITTIAEIVHARGGYVYGDGANFNAVMGKVKLGKVGVDIMHFNLHKTFTTPHGGGGPGAGPVGVVSELEPLLPVPRVVKRDDRYELDFDRPRSVGRIRINFGNFGMHVRAYTYIREMGAAGLRAVTEMAVLNANYILSQLRDTYHAPHPELCMHECVLNDKKQAAHGVKTMDIAKRLIDYGFHPPTVYFPLLVRNALMIEPTETESKESLDEFISAMKAIAGEAESDPQLLTAAPRLTYTGRVDEARAVRQPILTWRSRGQEPS
ncbi:MAG: aminomethyl-transferring glycine dehydrogenase subunit GcvPB [Myxococcales bacterium]|nr:aminomethyl-transferring glycine dehydrogenase subunit GcvPB [Myxococcales bacterium]